MPIIGLQGRVTADGSGDAEFTFQRNGLVSLVYVVPVGSVDGGSTAALDLDFVDTEGMNTKNIVAATGASSAVELWEMSGDGTFSVAKNRTGKVVIASAAENDEFDIYVDVIADD